MYVLIYTCARILYRGKGGYGLTSWVVSGGGFGARSLIRILSWIRGTYEQGEKRRDMKVSQCPDPIRVSSDGLGWGEMLTSGRHRVDRLADSESL